MIKLFVKHNININIESGHGLRRAIYRNYIDILEYLLSLPNIKVNKTHFTRKQYNYLDRKNKLDPHIISLFQKYNSNALNNHINLNSKLLLACSTQNNKQIKKLLSQGVDILSLGSSQIVFNHPIYKENDLIIESYARKYFAMKKIRRILFGRRGIIHNIKYKLGRKRVFSEFESLEEEINKKVRFE
jgi:hypothetical protein